MAVRIGPVSLLDDLPTSVEIDGVDYLLNRDEDGNPVLFSTECPHQGGTVEIADADCFRCPRHSWEFDPESGDAMNVPDESLSSYRLEERGGTLYADIPQADAQIEFGVTDDPARRPTVELLSHATLSIEYDGFTLVTDPWLDGPAFLDGWTHYPPPTCDVDAVAADADAIWITHEHPDHLHPRTLDHFPEDTPVYVPELNYRRLSTRLHDLGFEDVHSLPTDAPYRLAEDVEAVCFESNSTWNDSILAVNCGGFTILNFNDAGVNWKVNRAIPDADMVATGFSFGATGYPITWDHLSEERKREIVAERNDQQLRQCEQLVEMFDADYLLPFAKFFELVQPEHDPHRELLEKNRPRDVVASLEDADVTVVDLLPGEAWDGTDGSVSRRPDRERFFDEEFKTQYLRETFESMDSVVDEPFDLTHPELAAYFESLGESELAARIDDFALSLSLTGDERDLHALVRIRDSAVEYEPRDRPVSESAVDAEYYVRMACPGELVQYVVRNNRSWDDIHIGYWCTFDRAPDEYNLGFWRLLHAPWEARENVMPVAEDYDIETDLDGTTVADLVENEAVHDILADYGLHCAGCPQGLGEDIVEAARIHGLSPDQAAAMIRDLETEVSDSLVASD